MSNSLKKLMLTSIAPLAMMGAMMDPQESKFAEPSRPREPSKPPVPRYRTEEQRAARKLHKKRIKARQQARRRKGHH